MEKEELNKIILHDVPNLWDKQAYLKGYDFEVRTYRETYKTLKQMEIT